jgi:hypothetical protein
VIAAELPGRMGLIGALAGIRLVEMPLLKYDEMVILYEESAIGIGETAHFLWRLRQVEANNECRRKAREHIETTATRILGERWKVSD